MSEPSRRTFLKGSLAAGVLALDAEERVLAVNGAAARMLRQREEELLGRPIHAAWADPERARLVGGEGRIESQKGRGTTIIVDVPLMQKETLDHGEN